MSTPNQPYASETFLPASLSEFKWSSYLDHVSVVKDSLEERSNSDLVNEEEEQSTSGWAKALFGKRTGPPGDPDAIATRRSVFDDPHLAPFNWPKRAYENIHRFDPSARWTYREEKALLRKIDWKIMFMAAVSFSALTLERSDLGQANSANFLSDLHLTTNVTISHFLKVSNEPMIFLGLDFNMGNTIFRLSLLCAELPSQLISKRIGPDRWIPTQICLYGIVSLSQFWLTGRATFFTCRGLLGFFRGGFIAGLVVYMSYFYTKTELPIRLTGFWMFLNFCAIISSFLAYGILHLDGVAGKAGWRWLFLIEGLITLAIGVAFSFNMPPSPTQTRTWFRPNGWFTEREEVIIVNKVLRDDPTKGDMHNREGLTPKRLWTAICDYDLWPVYILGLTFGIPSSPPSTYLTLLLRNAGFDTFNTNLLTIPSQTMGIISMFLITLVSEFVNERSIVSMLENLWVLPFLVAIYVLPSSPWLFFGLLTGLLSYPSTHPIQVAWCSRNSGAVASRTVNAALYSVFVQASNIIAAQIYVASDAPRYERGNRILIIICSVNVFLFYPGTKAYYVWRNRQRAKIWDAMTSEEKVHYLNTTKDVGNRRLDFRFAH